MSETETQERPTTREELMSLCFAFTNEIDKPIIVHNDCSVRVDYDWIDDIFVCGCNKWPVVSFETDQHNEWISQNFNTRIKTEVVYLIKYNEVGGYFYQEKSSISETTNRKPRKPEEVFY